MKTVNTNKIAAVFIGVVLLSSVSASPAYAGLVQQFDLTANKTSNQTTAAPGGEWVFSLGATNNSQDTLDFGVLGDPLDSRLEFVSVVNDSDCFYDDVEHEVVCFLISLATGEEFSTDVTVRVDPTTPLGDEIPNRANVFGDDDDIPENTSDDIFLLVSNGCTCDTYSIFPKIASNGEWQIKGFVTKPNAAHVNVEIRMPWTVELLCAGSEGTCDSQFLLSGFELADWKSALGKGTGVKDAKGPDTEGNHFRVNSYKAQTGPSTIDCDAKCDEKKKIKGVKKTQKVRTKYTTMITNTDKTDARLDVSGTILLTLQISGSNPCANFNSWTMDIVIDSLEKPGEKKKNQEKPNQNTRINVIDFANSDFDGDGVKNIDEDANGDGDIRNDDSDNDGFPEYVDRDPIP